MIIILLIGLNLIGAQVAPYESSSIQTLEIEKFEVIHIPDLIFNKSIDVNLKAHSEFLINGINLYIENLISLDSRKVISLQVDYSGLPIGSKFFALSLDGKKKIGPFYVSSENRINIGPISESKFILQCVVPSFINLDNHKILFF